MKWRIGRVVLLLAAAFIVFFAVWTFWVPTRDLGGREITSARLPCALSWSPDGRWLQYRELDVRGVTAGVYLADADGSGGRLLDAGHMSFPAGWLERPTVPVVVEWQGTRPSIEMHPFSIDPGTGERKR